MRTAYESPDIDTTSAQRQAANAQESFTNFESVRAVASTATGQFAYGPHANRPSSAAQGDLYFEDDRGWLYYYTGTEWKFLAGLAFGTNATRGGITVTANDNGAAFWTTDQNKLWQVSSGTWVDRATTIDLTTSLKVNGIKVIGAQGAAVADPAGGAVIDAEARTQLALLLARCRAHGLIA